MRLLSASRLLAALAVVSVAASAAKSDLIYNWSYTKGQPGFSRSDAGGTIESLNSSFDATTKRLTYDVLFSGKNNAGGPATTSGFWLVISNGPDPKGTPGELAIVYFDATKVFNNTATTPTMTVYAYNGVNANTSWKDGNGDGVTDGGDLIRGSLQSGLYVNSITATTLAGGTERRMTFDIDATPLINKIPLFTAAGTTWQGTGYANTFGLWFHPVETFSATYDSGVGAKGKITSLSTGGEGFLDGANNTTIPAPGAGALLAMGGLIAVRRRRV